MFEQELYDNAPVEKPQEGDLFYNYERTNWDIGPRIYKIMAISAVFNIAVLGFIAQSDLLTRKGCDSPWVGRVCQVLDMAYVGSMLYGTERDFIDAEYHKIDLGDSEITFIDVSNAEPRFRYPADYDQYANPEKLLAQQADQALTSGFNTPLPTYSNPNSDMLARAPVLPKSNPNAITDDIPDSPFSVGDTPSKPITRKRGGNGRINGNRPAVNNTNSNQGVAQNNSNTNTNTTPPLTSEQVLAVEINKRPIVEYGNSINALREKAPLDLESEFSIMGKGKLDKNGRFDPKTFKFGPSIGKDETLVNVVKDGIEAINEAGYLAYIKDIIGKDLSFVLSQNAENLEATFQSDLDNDSLAKQRKTSLDLLIAFAKAKKQGENASQNEKDDLTLLEGIQTEVVGKTLKIKFVVPKEIAHPMIQRKLAEQAAELKKPNGQVTSKQNDNTALK